MCADNCKQRQSKSQCKRFLLARPMMLYYGEDSRVEEKHRSMVVLPSHKYLDERGEPNTRYSLPKSTEKGAANVARALGYRERQMVKTLVFETDKGERALVMLGGDQSAISGHLKKALGSRNIRLADPEIVLA